MDSKAASTVKPPVLPDYEFLDLLGEGSYGRVWRTVWRGGHERAVKVFKRERVDLGAIDRELKKLQLVREHSGIVSVYDFDLACETPYYAMSLHAQTGTAADGGKVWHGRTLESLCGAAAPAEVFRLLHQMAGALAYLHSHRVIHCDVKPSNVLLTDESPPSVKLCDFGQSRSSASVQLETSGTPFYAPPEQLRHPEQSGPDENGQVRGYRWDVYSFGVLAFKLATGKLPRLEELADAYRKADSGDRSLLPPSLSLHDHIPADHLATITEQEPNISPWPVNCGLAKEERRIIEKCLHLDPQQRWADMEEVKAAFIQAETDRKLSRARNAVILVSGLAVIAVVAGLFALTGLNEAERRSKEASDERDKKEIALKKAEELSEAREEDLVKLEEQRRLAVEAEQKAIDSNKKAQEFLRLADARNQEASVAAISSGMRSLGEDDAATASVFFGKAIHYHPQNLDARMMLASLMAYGAEKLPPLPLQRSRVSLPLASSFAELNPVVPIKKGDGLGFYQIYTGKEFPVVIPSEKGDDPADPSFPHCLCMSADGRYAAVQLADTKEVRVWDVAAGHWLGDALVHAAEPARAILANDGTRLATLDDRGTARLWAVPEQKMLGEHKHAEGFDLSVDRRFWAVTDAGKTQLHDALNGRKVRELQTFFNRWLGFSESGTYCCAVTRQDEAETGQIVTIWETSTGKAIKTVTVDTTLFSRAVFAPDETRALLNIGRPGKFQLIGLQEEAFVPQSTFEARDWRGNHLWLPDGLRLCAAGSVGSGDAIGELWAGKDWEASWELSESATTFLPSPDSGILCRIVGYGDEQALEFWDTRPLSETGLLLPLSGELRWAACSQQGTRALTVTELTETRAYTVGEDAPLAHEFSISKDGQRVSATHAGVFMIWDVSSGKPVFTLSVKTDDGDDMVVTPDPEEMNLVASADSETTVTIRTLNGSRPSLVLKVPDFVGVVESFAFAQGGQWLELQGDSRDVWIRLSDQKTLEGVLGLSDENDAAMLSSDGRWAWSKNLEEGGSNEGKIQFWDVGTRKPLCKPFEPEEEVDSIFAFSPDGARALAAGPYRNVAQLFATQAGEHVNDLEDTAKTSYIDKGYLEEEGYLSFHPVGKWVQTPSMVWDAETGVPLAVDFGGAQVIKNALITPDGAWGVTLDYEGTVQRWDLVHGRKAGAALKLSDADDGCLRDLSDDGRWVGYSVTTGDDPQLAVSSFHIMDAATGAALQEHIPNGGPVVESVLYGGDKVVTRDGAGLFRVLPINDARKPSVLIETGKIDEDGWETKENWLMIESRVLTTAWNLDTGNQLDVRRSFLEIELSGSRLLTRSEGNVIEMWDAASGRRISALQFPGMKSEPDKPVEPDYLAVVWDLATGERIGPIQKFVPQKGDALGIIKTVAFSPKGDLAALAMESNSVRLWQVEDGSVVPGKIEHHGTDAMPMQFGSDGVRLLTTSDERTVRLWDVTNGQPVGAPMQHADEIKMARFSPDAKHIATVDLSGHLRFWNAETGQPSRQSLELGEPLTRVSFSKDGRWVALAGGFHVWLWSWQGSDKPVLLKGPEFGGRNPDEYGVAMLQFTPDDRRLLAAGDGYLLVWDVDTQKIVSQIEDTDELDVDIPFGSQEFPVSADGRWLVVPTDEGGAVVVSLDSGKPVANVPDLLDADGNSVKTLTLNPSTGWMVMGSRCGARVRKLPELGESRTEEWLPNALAMLSGKKLDSRQEVIDVTLDERLKLRSELLATLKPEPGLARQIAWMLADRRDRPLWPGGTMTVSQGAERLLRHQRELRRSGKDYDVKAADQVLREAYVMDPEHPLVHLAIAATMKAEKQAAFLREYDLKRLPQSCDYSKQLNAADVCAFAAEMCLEQGDGERARIAANKALALQPDHAKARRVLAGIKP